MRRHPKQTIAVANVAIALELDAAVSASAL
jgi:hypothetical protein